MNQEFKAAINKRDSERESINEAEFFAVFRRFKSVVWSVHFFVSGSLSADEAGTLSVESYLCRITQSAATPTVCSGVCRQVNIWCRWLHLSLCIFCGLNAGQVQGLGQDDAELRTMDVNRDNGWMTAEIGGGLCGWAGSRFDKGWSMAFVQRRWPGFKLCVV